MDPLMHHLVRFMPELEGWSLRCFSTLGVVYHRTCECHAHQIVTVSWGGAVIYGPVSV